MSLRKNRRLAIKLAAVAFFMFGFAYLLVPLYDIFCEITGLNGKIANAAAEPREMVVDEKRTVAVQFFSHTNEPGKLLLNPTVATMEIKPGALYTTHYKAQNLSSEAMVGRAVPSVAPGVASRYLEKVECFCFEDQALAPMEERLMPVRFRVNPKLPQRIKTISLSYAFFDARWRENVNAN